MKIAHVVDSMEVGGAETLVSQMCRLQRNQGHDPCIYAVAALGPLGEQLLTEGFAVRPNVGLHLSDSVRNFYRIFNESHPDVVHLHNPTPTIYAAIPARMAGVASIISTRHSLVASPRDKIMELKFAVAATSCDWVVGICDATVNNLREIHTVPARKIARVYNGAMPLARTAQGHLPFKSGFTFVFVGRLSPVKNLGLMLHAFQRAALSMPDLQLWMVGDGSDRMKLEELTAELGISSNVRFWGQQLDVARYFSAADAFIMSSKSEGLPMSLLQAFSLGLPAIVTNVGGMAEAVKIAAAGHIVPVDDPAAMATAILHLATSDAERHQFSTNASATFHSRFTLQTMSDAYIDLYRNTPKAQHIK